MIVKSRNPPIEADVIAVNRSGVTLPGAVTTNSREGKSVTYGCGGEGGIPTHANLCYPTLSAVTKPLYLKHLAGLRRIIKLAAAKNTLKSRRATQQT